MRSVRRFIGRTLATSSSLSLSSGRSPTEVDCSCDVANAWPTVHCSVFESERHAEARIFALTRQCDMNVIKEQPPNSY